MRRPVLGQAHLCREGFRSKVRSQLESEMFVEGDPPCVLHANGPHCVSLLGLVEWHHLEGAYGSHEVLGHVIREVRHHDLVEME